MTATLPCLLLKISESSQAAEARRIAIQTAENHGFGEEAAGRVAIIASEMAANLVKHARDGRIQIRMTDDNCIELLAFDSGPGMKDASACLRDGFSTAGTSGTGLGAIRRLAADFDLYSQEGKGTVVVARVRSTQQPAASNSVQIGAVRVPARGETVCGDSWTLVSRDGSVTVLVADGLGHGPMAAEASQRAAAIVEAGGSSDPAIALERVHAALRSTRGAAVAIAQLLPEHKLVRYAGLGNIGAVIFGSNGIQRLVSHNGTAGAQARRIQPFEYSWPDNGLLVMYSDGLASHWDLSSYPGLTVRDPASIAAVLYRDHNRGRDDATVIALRVNV